MERTRQLNEQKEPYPLISNPQDSPSRNKNDAGPLYASQQNATATRIYLNYKDGNDIHLSSHSPTAQNPSAHPLLGTETSHELELDRLMTLHLQRNQAISASQNTLEKLLAADNPSTIRLSPAIRASHEFLLGMQHEQSELWAKTEDLEVQIAATQDHMELARLENMLGLTIALSFELMLEEGAFRDSYERKRVCEGWDFGREFEEMRERVGGLIGEYDEKMERLEEG